MTLNQSLETQLHDFATQHFKPDQPGASVIVVRDGQTLLRAGFGMANLELGVPIQPEMVFRLASVTKQFTAVAILMLEGRGLLSLQDPIERYIADYPTHGHTITIEHLLTHTSGIKSFTSMPEFRADEKADKSVADQIAFFKEQPMEFAPGERWQYNNSGYVLLGAIIENVSGLSYEDFLKQNVFDRLGMTHTYYDLHAKLIPGRVSGYTNGPNGIENAPYISMTRPYAAGSLASNVDDLAKWCDALYGDVLLPQSALERAWTPYKLANGFHNYYGYGWGIGAYEGNRWIEHGGGIDGFATHFICFPELRIFVGVLMNCVPPVIHSQMLAFKLGALAMGKPVIEPRSISLEGPALKKLLGRYQIRQAVHFDVTFTEQAGQLHVQFDDDPNTQALIALSPTDFALRDSLMQLRFVLDDAGHAKSVQLLDRGMVAVEGMVTPSV